MVAGSAAPRVPSPPALANLSVDALNQELRRRARSLKILRRKHKKALGTAADLEAQIRELGGDADGRRCRNEGSVVEHLAAVLKGRAMGLEEAAEAVLKRGYPPDKQEKATQTVLEQAELLLSDAAA